MSICRISILSLAAALAACGEQDRALAPAPAGTTESTATSAPRPASGPERHILAFGDSLFAGLGVGKENSYPAQLETALREDGINARIANNERTLVTTHTKKMAEDLSAYLTNAGIRCRYLHHDIGAIERMEIIRDLRTGAFDVLVGINLLREGLDLPEVSLVAILDADKEGFLRSETSLIQTIGRAARNAEGTVIMYADQETAAMHAAILETNRRRAKQAAYNQAHGIVPKTIVKSVRELLEISSDVEAPKRADGVKMTEAERRAEIARLEAQMKKAAEMLEYEYAAVLRDRLIELRGQ